MTTLNSPGWSTRLVAMKQYGPAGASTQLLGMLRLHDQLDRVAHRAIGLVVMQVELDRVRRAQLIRELLAAREREARLPEEILLSLHRQLCGLRARC